MGRAQGSQHATATGFEVFGTRRGAPVATVEAGRAHADAPVIQEVDYNLFAVARMLPDGSVVSELVATTQPESDLWMQDGVVGVEDRDALIDEIRAELAHEIDYEAQGRASSSMAEDAGDLRHHRINREPAYDEWLNEIFEHRAIAPELREPIASRLFFHSPLFEPGAATDARSAA